MKDIKKKSIIHFDAQASDYDKRADGKFSAAAYQELLKRTVAGCGKYILDIGCGNGNILCALSAMNKELCLNGLDLSPKMVKEAKRRLGDAANLLVGDAEELPFQNHSMDIMICNMSFHHYPHPQNVLKEMKRVLKRNGILLIGETNPPFLLRKFINATSRFTTSGDYKMYSKQELEHLFLSCGWKMEGWMKPNLLSCVFAARRI